MSATVEQLKQRLAVLEPQQLDVTDESALHTGHSGAAGGGGHYRLIIVSEHFKGMNAVARHRAIYQALGDMMREQIHALSISAFTPEEF
ncbi:MAG: BolA family transcriptional regulator [Parasulfuritortus sp.]|nr:BolA family transcriptional regulator [Parasulfuritortus sp.]